MAEYVEVMKQKRRMCNSYALCIMGCPLNDIDFCSKNSGEKIFADFPEVERRVMSWAAEHFEPVYPTWGDYLISKGLLMPYWNERGTAPYDMYIYAERALANHIPADIAEKLGLKPKEG